MVKSKKNPAPAHASIWHLVAGVIMAALGVYVWLNPVVSLVALALYLGIAFIVVGLGYAVASFSYESGWYLLVGILDVLVGVILVTNLGVTAATLPIIFALWCLAVGAIQIVAAYRLHKNGYKWSWSLVAGILGVIFAFLILAYPMLGVVTLSALMGAYILLYGIVEILEYTTNRRTLVVVAE